jgi:hypothetical protein
MQLQESYTSADVARKCNKNDSGSWEDRKALTISRTEAVATQHTVSLTFRMHSPRSKNLAVMVASLYNQVRAEAHLRGLLMLTSGRE